MMVSLDRYMYILVVSWIGFKFVIHLVINGMDLSNIEK